MATTAQFVAVANPGFGTVSAANTNRDGTGTIVDILTAGASGSRIDYVTIQATGTTTAGMVRLYLHNGSAYKLLREIAVTAITASATVAAYTNTISFIGGLIIPTGWKLCASTEKAETFNVIAYNAGNF